MVNNLVLVLNCGSSSIKFSILNVFNQTKVLFGIIECINSNNTKIIWSENNQKNSIHLGNKVSHIRSFKYLIKNVFDKNDFIMNNIICIGHRIVHGGIHLKESCIINDYVIDQIKKNSIFAPLHNPINLLGIKACIKYFPKLHNKNVAVFDTAFYHTLPEKSFLYAIPYSLYQKYHIRRYGAHGISHLYITRETSKLLNIDIKHLNIISCHLGGGCSITAIENGIAVDTSMGLTPLEGLVMGTRSGDLDPSIIFFMYNELNMSIHEIQDVLINKSGMIGLTDGLTSDFRDIENEYSINIKKNRAIDIFCYRLSKYISAYTSVLHGRLDAIVFTGGIGENSILVRKLTLSNLSLLGVRINDDLNINITKVKLGFINQENTIPVLVIPTNEELVIAQESYNTLY